jgi:hypothetical protein
VTRARIVIHATQPLEMLSGIVEVLTDIGFEVDRAGYDISDIVRPDAVRVVWGMRYNPDVYAELACHRHVFFMENGWFTQRTACYIDKKGPNALSSIRGLFAGAAARPLSAIEAVRLRRFTMTLRRRLRINPVRGMGDFILVPLQVERDTQLLFWSGCAAGYPNRQAWFVNQVCRAFPEQPIVIRPHPRDPAVASRIQSICPDVRAHRNVQFRGEGSSYDWIAGAAAVAGINSTVLLEALMLFKPVCAMGYGVFSENKVVLECDGHPDVLPELTSFNPSRIAIERFLHLLLARQVPYALKVQDIADHPVLASLIRVASPEIAGQIERRMRDREELEIVGNQALIASEY